MPQAPLRARWSIVLALVTQFGCYPDPDKIRVLGLRDAASPALESGAGPEVGPLLPPNASGDNCSDFGIAWCEKARQCQSFTFQDLGAENVCAGRMKLWCETLLATPADTSWDASRFKTCISSWSLLTCDQWHDADVEILKGPGCFVPGKRGEGAGCWSFTQCGSLECARTAACGKCVPLAPLDGACAVDSDCQRPALCAREKCALPVGPGAACDSARPCRRSLVCKNGVCGPKAADGQACIGDDECAAGLLCNATTKTCGRASTSDRCSSNEEDGTILYCGGGSRCDHLNMCVAPAGDGEMCSEMDLPDCLWPAGCISGRCILPKGVNCPAQPGGPAADAGVPSDAAISADGPLATGRNNAADLTGPMITGGMLSGAELSKPLKVKVTTPNPKFEIVAAHALGPGMAVEWVVAVKSLSTDLDCGITASSFVIRDATGGTVAMDDGGAVNGSVGITMTGWSDNCLRGGETGYLFGITISDTADLYAAADSIDLAISSALMGTPPPTRVVPLSYQTADVGFSIKVRNDGPGPARLSKDGISMYVLMNADGSPVGWGFLETVTPEGTLAPGATAELSPSSFFFQGQAARMWVIVDFEQP